METVRLYQYTQVQDYLKVCPNKTDFEVNEDLLSEVFQNKDYRYNPSLSFDEEIRIRAVVVQDMKTTHERLIRLILNQPDVQMRWVSAYFPFTEPSYELEAFFNGKWVEMLGCGFLIRSYS